MCRALRISCRSVAGRKADVVNEKCVKKAYTVAMVGDGITMPGLAAADVGFALAPALNVAIEAVAITPDRVVSCRGSDANRHIAAPR